MRSSIGPLLLLALLAACSTPDADSPHATPTPSSKPVANGGASPSEPASPDEPTEPKSAAEEPVIKVETPGTEPLTIFRFAPKDGAQIQVVGNYDSKWKYTSDSAPAASPESQTEFHATVHIVDVDSSGGIEYELRLPRLTSPQGQTPKGGDPAPAAAVNANLNAITQGLLRGRVEVNGETNQPAISVGGTDASHMMMTVGPMIQLLVDESPIFPETAVGVGARWSVDRERERDRTELHVRTEYEVVRVQGDTWTLKFTEKVEGNEQPLEVPFAPNPNMTLETFEGRGSGTLEVSTKHWPISSGEMSMKNHSIVRGGRGRSVSDGELEWKLSSK